jgi:hypothetical protein
MADTYTQREPAVIASYTVGRTLLIRTFSGVEIFVQVCGVRKTSSGPVYDVKPVGDLKVKEFQKAGVPVTDSNAADQFVAFDWQVIR